MSLKKLNKFSYFDFEGFSEGKKYLCIGLQDWKDFNSGEIIGTKVTAVIAQDKTDYELQNGEVVNNLYEKLDFKIGKKINIPLNVEVRPINAEATIYGDYRNQLSIIAEDIEVIGK